jgi:hypothetical protein
MHEPDGILFEDGAADALWNGMRKVGNSIAKRTGVITKDWVKRKIQENLRHEIFTTFEAFELVPNDDWVKYIQSRKIQDMIEVMNDSFTDEFVTNKVVSQHAVGATTLKFTFTSKKSGNVFFVKVTPEFFHVSCNSSFISSQLAHDKPLINNYTAASFPYLQEFHEGYAMHRQGFGA